jgi:DNA-binding CsgD family transcriptional regulator
LEFPPRRGAALRCRGLLARDPDVLLAAVAAYRRSPRLLELAQTCEDAAVHLAGAGRRQAANELLQEASQIRPSTVWESLTDSERRVAELVAEGATNREVAATLVISTHTVDAHLRHVFAKLGIASRVQLATIVAKQGR